MKITLGPLFATTLIVVATFAGCKRPTTSSESTKQWINPNELKVGPIRRSSLSEAQMGRVQRIQEVFSEVDPTPVEKWVEDFKRDSDPDRELNIWESMATAYDKFTTANALVLDAKKEVFQVVLTRPGAPDDEVLKHLKLKFLTEEQAREIMGHMTIQPAPIRVASPK